MTRRELIKLIATGAIGASLDIDRLLWEKGKKTILIPNPKEVYLYGIPYHQSNAGTDSWLGINRIGYDDIVNLIKAINKDLNQSNL